MFKNSLALSGKMKTFLFLMALLFVIAACRSPSPGAGDSDVKAVYADQNTCVQEGGTWVEQPFEGFYRCAIPDERACAAYGGDWIPQGLLGETGCVFTYPDAGQSCTSSDQCLGGCVVDDPTQTTGQCKETDSPFGCWTFLNGPAMCVD